MMTPKRSPETPWQAIDVMTNECVGWYSDSDAAHRDPRNADKSLSVLWRPGRKRK